jgi:hypothetical protein
MSACTAPSPSGVIASLARLWSSGSVVLVASPERSRLASARVSDCGCTFSRPLTKSLKRRDGERGRMACAPGELLRDCGAAHCQHLPPVVGLPVLYCGRGVLIP